MRRRLVALSDEYGRRVQTPYTSSINRPYQPTVWNYGSGAIGQRSASSEVRTERHLMLVPYAHRMVRRRNGMRGRRVSATGARVDHLANPCICGHNRRAARGSGQRVTQRGARLRQKPAANMRTSAGCGAR